ncbi:hypothetical protein DL89DRAFT_264142 [Linderina pennispora]|uniref:Uncharacterized protein n=1 Tax=Linderina pennispora TaxID=61395 RepID=A0A1Y1WL47_9FUNG|nr:uncharacterized protein DL89DRAFT_264142 [Linderina pennispora]ORX74203.1 hypothetical protein DL89DRAFT_264142 [Linderina pennispora]
MVAKQTQQVNHFSDQQTRIQQYLLVADPPVCCFAIMKSKFGVMLVGCEDNAAFFALSAKHGISYVCLLTR